MKKSKILIISAALIACAGIVLGVRSVQTPNTYTTVMDIDGEPVAFGELLECMKGRVSDTYSYFKANYGVDDSEDFWTQQHGDTSPIEYLKQLAKVDVVDRKIRQTILKQNGILNDISYSAFKKELSATNAERNQAVKQNKVIYGPVEYSEMEYFIYIISNHEIKLKEKLSQSTLTVSDQQIEQRYQDDREEKYKYADKITVLIDGEQRIFSHQTARYDSNSDTELYNMVYGMNVGDRATLRQLEIECVARESGGYMELEMVGDVVKQNIIDDLYEDMIKKKKSEAKIKIYDKPYKKLKIR